MGLFNNKKKQEVKEDPLFKETFPKVSSTYVPNNIPYEEWKAGKWVEIKREPINEQLKKK